MNIGIEVVYHDGTKDWIDPVDQDDFEIMEANANDVYKIRNPHYVYEYKVSDVKELRQYRLTECCGFDVRTENHAINCPKNECNID